MNAALLFQALFQSCPESSLVERTNKGLWSRPGLGHVTARPPQLHQLKRKLLRAALEETPDPRLFKKLCGAANQAADRAWATGEPLLVFPCLFEEMLAEARAGFLKELPAATVLAEAFKRSPAVLAPRALDVQKAWPFVLTLEAG